MKEPTIQKMATTRLIGMSMRMSFVEDKTHVLWSRFMPRRKEITASGPELFSIEIRKDANWAENFDPAAEFEKWAAVAVSNYEVIPNGMSTFEIPEGTYAVFPYKGKPSEARVTFQYIYGTWLPNSQYLLDHRPYFALMGEKYLGEHPDSEEEFWIPVRMK